MASFSQEASMYAMVWYGILWQCGWLPANPPFVPFLDHTALLVRKVERKKVIVRLCCVSIEWNGTTDSTACDYLVLYYMNSRRF